MLNKSVSVVVRKSGKDSNEVLIDELKEAPDGYFNQINCIDVLEKEDSGTIDLICSKVRKNGKLVLVGFDAISLCRMVYKGTVSLEDATENFFKHVKNLNSVLSIKKYFTERSNGWSIDFASVKDNRYMVEVTRV